MDKIQQLQSELAKDLVMLEELDISEQQLEIIETTYQQVYDILSNMEKAQ